MGIEGFLTFLGTALLFIMTPGIDTVFVLNKSVVQGKKSGIKASFGVNAGVLVHTVFAALGLSLIIAESAWAFEFIKYLGAAYLFYLGVMKLIRKDKTSPANRDKLQTNRSQNNFLSGLFTNTLNPKVALFFLAFFPQFIDPDKIDDPVPFIVLGLTYAVMGTLWFVSLSLFAGVFAQKFKSNPKVGQWLNKFSGVVFILMGIKIALTAR